MFCIVSIKGVIENFSLVCEVSVFERRVFLYFSCVCKLEWEKKMDLYFVGIIFGIYFFYFEGIFFNVIVNSVNFNILYKYLIVKMY